MQLVQDAFVAVHRTWDKVRDPLPYLRRTVVNRCRSWGRRQTLERDRRPATAPAAELVADELWDALGRLPERQREAIVCRFCGLDMEGRAVRPQQPSAPPRPSAAPPVAAEPTRQQTWNPGVAAVLSFFLPGVGQIYKGRIAFGFVLFVLTLAVNGLAQLLIARARRGL